MVRRDEHDLRLPAVVGDPTDHDVHRLPLRLVVVLRSTDTYWAGSDEWDYTTAAMEGSSYYNLPRVLQWFSGNIGYHHIHHLNPQIPNYNLERCHLSHPFFQQAPELRFFSSLKTIKLRLWDEVNGRMISFGELKRQLAVREAKPSV